MRQLRLLFCHASFFRVHSVGKGYVSSARGHLRLFLCLQGLQKLTTRTKTGYRHFWT